MNLTITITFSTKDTVVTTTAPIARILYLAQEWIKQPKTKSVEIRDADRILFRFDRSISGTHGFRSYQKGLFQ